MRLGGPKKGARRAGAPTRIPRVRQIYVELERTAFNWRDVFIAKSLYPGICGRRPSVPTKTGSEAVALPARAMSVQVMRIAFVVSLLDARLEKGFTSARRTQNWRKCVGEAPEQLLRGVIRVGRRT